MVAPVLIVEDHPLYRAALLQVVRELAGSSDTLTVGTAEEGLALSLDAAWPAMIVLDFNLPGMNGVEAILAFRRKFPGSPLVVVSASEDRRDAEAALRVGASAFVSKAVSAECLSDVMRRLIAGDVVASEWVVPAGKIALGDDSAMKLTPRQQDTLLLLAKGYSNKEIGLRLGLAEITVKVHVSALFRTLNVVNRTQAVLAARRMGLCPDGDPSTPL